MNFRFVGMITMLSAMTIGCGSKEEAFQEPSQIETVDALGINAVGMGVLQGMLIDENFQALRVQGAAVRVRQAGANSPWTYHKIEPVYGVVLEEGIYEIDLDIPGRKMFYSSCEQCVAHPESSFRRMGDSQLLTISIKANQFIDLRFAATTRPINVSATIQGMLVDENMGALLLPGAGIWIKPYDTDDAFAIPIEPVFGVNVPPGIYELFFSAPPSRWTSMSACRNCVDHPISDFAQKKDRILVNVGYHEYVDVRVRAALSSVLPLPPL